MIIRTPKGEYPHFSALRSTAQDRTLTFEARGLLFYLLSKPSDWVVQVPDLMQECGRDKVYRILNELIEHKYLWRSATRQNDGKFSSYDYQLFESPQYTNPFPEIPYTDLPLTENADSTYIENQQTKDSSEEKPKGEKRAKKTVDSIAQPLNDAVAQYIQGIPDRAGQGKLTGQIAAVIGSYWCRRLDKPKLDAEDYKKAARSVKPFVEAFLKIQGNRLNWINQVPSRVEDWYAKLIPLLEKHSDSQSQASSAVTHAPDCPGGCGGKGYIVIDNVAEFCTYKGE